MKYTEVTFDPLGRIRLPSGSAIGLDWNGFDKMAEPVPPSKIGEELARVTRAALGDHRHVYGTPPLPRAHVSEIGVWDGAFINPPTREVYFHASIPPMKRKQRGGIKKGRSWRREASDRALSAVRSFDLGLPTLARFQLFMALDVIRAHSRNLATRAEAQRLLTVLETRNG